MVPRGSGATALACEPTILYAISFILTVRGRAAKLNATDSVLFYPPSPSADYWVPINLSAEKQTGR